MVAKRTIDSWPARCRPRIRADGRNRYSKYKEKGMTNKATLKRAVLVVCSAAMLTGAGVGHAFNIGNMMNPSKWFGGGNRDRDYYDYGGPGYGYGGPGYGYGGPGYGYGGPGWGYGAPGYGYGAPGYGYGAPGYGYGAPGYGYGAPGYGYGAPGSGYGGEGYPGSGYGGRVPR
jgi:hypothetical protein